MSLVLPLNPAPTSGAERKFVVLAGLALAFAVAALAMILTGGRTAFPPLALGGLTFFAAAAAALTTEPAKVRGLGVMLIGAASPSPCSRSAVRRCNCCNWRQASSP